MQDGLQVAQGGRVAEDDRRQLPASIVPNRASIRRRASASLLRIWRATASRSIIATPISRSQPATVDLPQPMLPVRPMTFMRPPVALCLRRLLAVRAEVGAALPDHDPLDRPAAPEARLAGPPIDHQPLGVVAGLVIGPDVVAEAGAPVADPLAQDRADGAMQTAHLVRRQRVGGRSGWRRARHSASSA